MSNHSTMQITIRILLICLISLTCSANQNLTIAWDSWPPHQFEGENGEPTGVNIDLVQEICRRAGFQTRFRKVPWQRGLTELQSGGIHIVMSATKTDERAEYAYFSDSYFKLEFNVMFVRKSDMAKYKDIQSLKEIIGSDFRLGITRGAVYSDEHASLETNPGFLKNVQIVDVGRQNLNKLMLGRIDGFIEDELAGAALIKEARLHKDVDALFYLYGAEEASSYLMFSKKSMTQEQVDTLNSALQSMKTDGEYSKILDNYRLMPDFTEE